MINRNKVTVAALIALLLFFAVAIVKQPQPAKAQGGESESGGFERVSFGMVGITSGQTLRVTVANTIMPSDANLPPGPCRVTISFRYLNGNLVRDARTGEVIKKVVDLNRGDATFLDVDYSDLPPGPTRAQIRPVVVRRPPPVTEVGQNAVPPDGTVPTVEIINNANGRTQFAMFVDAGSIRGFNPQPDPPLEQ